MLPLCQVYWSSYFTRVGSAAFGAAGSTIHISRDAAAAAAAARASGSGAAGRAEARVGHPAAVEARSWGPLGGNSWIEGFNPTPALNRRGGPLRTPAGGKFEFEPNEG